MDWSPSERSAGANYHFMVSAVAPRPIAWVTTRSRAGVVNAAPFSWFQAICADPPMVMLAIGDREPAKDTLRNVEATREFVVNAATREQAEAVVQSSAEYAAEASEVDALGLETVPGHEVAPPRLAAAPFHLECRLVETRHYGRQKGSTLVIGEVVHVHADDGVLDARGNVDPAKVRFLARLGGRNYTSVDDVFELERPTAPDR